MSNLKVLDLFAGVGGFSLGLHRAGGFETAAFVEIDKHCQDVLKKNFPKTPIANDIKNLYFTEDGVMEHDGAKGRYFWQVTGGTKIDVICGGFPCTDISIGGKQKGLVDENGERTRSGLWFEYARIIDEIRPKWVVIENVSALRGNGLRSVLLDLNEIGYDAEWHCITANSVGYPHQRDRLFIIAHPRCLGLYERLGKGGHLQSYKEWEASSLYSEGKGRIPESIEVRSLLSSGSFDRLRSTYPDERAAITGVRRVTDGIPEGLDESRRKQRVKQMGNALIPRIAEIIGRRILEIEKELTNE